MRWRAAWAEAAALPDLTRAAPGTAPFALLGQALAGRWRGTLTYRDYGNDKRVVLPTSASIDGASDALRAEFIYDDGPAQGAPWLLRHVYRLTPAN